jgi:tetratricopeptide (TPR) repeat protein
MTGIVAAADGSPYFAPVTHFVSHAWHASFPQLVATLELYAAGGDSIAAFFLDIFAINQHVPPWREDPPMRHSDVLGPPIVACRRTVLVLQPWEKPTSFTRAWCLFEIMTTLDAVATLDVALSQAEQGRFVETLTENFDDIMKNISSIDARKATATMLEDRDAIFGLIESGTGFNALNNSVMTAIRAWLVDAARTALTEVEGTAGVASVEAATLLYSIGMLYKGQGRHEEALEAYGRVLEVQRKALGEEHPDFANTLNNIAVVYNRQGRY